MQQERDSELIMNRGTRRGGESASGSKRHNIYLRANGGCDVLLSVLLNVVSEAQQASSFTLRCCGCKEENTSVVKCSTLTDRYNKVSKYYNEATRQH